ncbi:HNH endonuclease [soil metagenome]
MNSSEQQAKWLTKLSTLKVDKARGDPAPHKPIMLLVFCDLAEDGGLGHDCLLLSGEIAFRFASYWSVVASRRSQAPEVRLPFFHLKGDGVLRAFDKFGNPATDKKANAEVLIDPALVDCLFDPEFRRKARLLLMGTYFRAAEQLALASLLELPLLDAERIKKEAASCGADVAIQTGRDARFRLTVVPAYDYTCALTRYRFVTVDSGALVDAAHIHQFSDSRNNSPSNGLALSKNAHWMFDNGLWSLDDHFRVIIKPDRFQEAGPAPMRLAHYAGRQILLPNDDKLRPSLTHLAWHRRNHGFLIN